MPKKILITGIAGFIGFHLTKKLVDQGFEVTGVDNINNYYDISLKLDRLKVLGIDHYDQIQGRSLQSSIYSNLEFYYTDISDKIQVLNLFQNKKFEVVIHLAAQADVRYSIENPDVYLSSNINGTFNILEACRFNPVEHLIFASSSSVYGLNSQIPFSVNHNVDHPISLYAASKKSNELMAHVYAYQFKIPVTGLRFFTVYGPWGRPDMAVYKFTKNILAGKPIEVYHNGNMQRDFTYVDDITESIYRLIPLAPKANSEWNTNLALPSTSIAPYRIFNIGNNSPVNLMDFVQEIEKATNKKAIIKFEELQKGDVEKTWADTSELFDEIDFLPKTLISDGIASFVNWYKEYYHI